MLFVVVLILAGPTAIFWIQWMMPAERFPADIDAHFAAEGAAATPLMDQFERILVEQRRASGAPSVSAAISRRGALVWAGASGLAEIESAEPATPDVLYRLGSTSKALTGVLLGRLIDAGEIDLDARVADHAPELPQHLHAITVRQLASHTAGVRHYRRVPTWLPARNESITARHYASVEEGLALFVDDALLFPPGSDFSYSTFGFSLLAHLMERATGSAFASLVDEHIDAPLGTDVRLDDPSVRMADRATACTTGKGRWGPAYPADPSYKWAGGGLVASPSDLVRIGDAHMNDAFVSTASRSLLFAPVAVPGSDTDPQNYGLGWRVATSTRTLGEDRPVRMLHHGGIQMGGVAFWAIYPQLGMSVAVVANTGDPSARGAVQDTAYAMIRAAVAAGGSSTSAGDAPRAGRSGARFECAGADPRVRSCPPGRVEGGRGCGVARHRGGGRAPPVLASRMRGVHVRGLADAECVRRPWTRS